MKYTTKAAEKSTMKITMKFDADEWKDALNKAYVKTKGRYSVNGFRKGKAPRNVIEHAYGRAYFSKMRSTFSFPRITAPFSIRRKRSLRRWAIPSFPWTIFPTTASPSWP